MKASKTIFACAVALSIFGYSALAQEHTKNDVEPVDSCNLLTDADPAYLLGKPIGETRPMTQMHTAQASISHCLIQSDDTKSSITLRIRNVPRRMNPTSRDEYANTIGEGLQTQISQGDLVPDLGDLAFWYEYGGLNLVVLWKQSVMMTVTVDGAGNHDRELQIALEVAGHVIDEY